MKAWLPLFLLACTGAALAADPAPAPRPIGVPDPMDVVRERLAQRLGVIKPSENPNVLRVVSKPITAGVEPSASASAPRRADAPAKPVAHRASTKPAEKAGAEHIEHAEHWDYQGSGGPERWGRMKPEFAKCSSGTRQSPIDIRDGIKVELDPVQFDYKPSAFKVVDNGHTIQVNVAPGNAIEVMGQRFELVQFHFHRPSEERIDGKAFDMVAHLVHKNLEGRLAVVAVLLEKGSAQPIVQSVWNNLPLEKGDEIAARMPIDLNRLLPAERAYFTYMGSLTTPPCSDGVRWQVLKQPVELSPQQIAAFHQLYKMNARPVQPLNGRTVEVSE
jgi:carbonic anhydrase